MVDEAVSAATLLENFDYPDNFELVEIEEDTAGSMMRAPPTPLEYEYDETDARVISMPQGPGEIEASKTFHGPGGATPGKGRQSAQSLTPSGA